VIRQGAGPALVFSFILLGAACALAGLCYAELASMIPQAGSAYVYSYATLGELVAWIIRLGPDPRVRGRQTSRSRFVGRLLQYAAEGGRHRDAGVVDDRLSHGLAERRSGDPRLLESANTPHIAGIPIVIHVPAFAIVMLITVLLLQGAKESVTATTSWW